MMDEPNESRRGRGRIFTGNVGGWLAFASALALAAPASAALLIVDGAGQLLGARDVDVDGVLYEVQFRDDTFTSIFGDASGLDATSQADAVLFADALVDQVFVNSDLGAFDDDPELLFGCGATVNSCEVILPFALDGALVETVTARNRRVESPSPDEIVVNAYQPDLDSDLAEQIFRVYGDFVAQAPPPAVPSIGPKGLVVLATLVLGVGALAMRRRPA